MHLIPTSILREEQNWDGCPLGKLQHCTLIFFLILIFFPPFFPCYRYLINFFPYFPNFLSNHLFLNKFSYSPMRSGQKINGTFFLLEPLTRSLLSPRAWWLSSVNLAPCVCNKSLGNVAGQNDDNFMSLSFLFLFYLYIIFHLNYHDNLHFHNEGRGQRSGFQRGDQEMYVGSAMCA